MENRGYNTMKKVDSLERSSLLTYKSKATIDERVPLVVRYNRNLPNIQIIVHDCFVILERSERLSKLFTKAPITAFKRDVNLTYFCAYKA